MLGCCVTRNLDLLRKEAGANTSRSCSRRRFAQRTSRRHERRALQDAVEAADRMGDTASRALASTGLVTC
jgi:hypothetical protein